VDGQRLAGSTSMTRSKTSSAGNRLRQRAPDPRHARTRINTVGPHAVLGLHNMRMFPLMSGSSLRVLLRL